MPFDKANDALSKLLFDLVDAPEDTQHDLTILRKELITLIAEASNHHQRLYPLAVEVAVVIRPDHHHTCSACHHKKITLVNP